MSVQNDDVSLDGLERFNSHINGSVKVSLGAGFRSSIVRLRYNKAR